MGNECVSRLPSGNEMMTLVRLHGLLNNHAQSLPSSYDKQENAAKVDALNQRIDRMMTRIRKASGRDARGGRSNRESLNYLDRFLMVSLLERYFHVALDMSTLVWSLETICSHVTLLFCNVLCLEKASSNVKCLPRTYWILAKDVDSAIDLYAFICVTVMRVWRAYHKDAPHASSLDERLREVISNTGSFLWAVLSKNTDNGVLSLYENAEYRDKVPRPAFNEAQRKHWVTRFDRAYAGYGQRGSRLSVSEIRQLFGPVVVRPVRSSSSFERTTRIDSLYCFFAGYCELESSDGVGRSYDRWVL